MKNGCEEILKSKDLSIVLELILELGNFLNAKTPRGEAFGFTVNSLLKVNFQENSFYEKILKK